MGASSPPTLNLEYVCITSNNDAVVAALISTYFNHPGTYFIVLTFPKLETAYTESIDFQKDDYFAQLMGTQAATRINNVIARLQPVFYDHSLTKGTLLDSFYEMTRAIKEAKYRNIYSYWGLHFNTLKPPLQKADQEVFNVLVASLASMATGI